MNPTIRLYGSVAGALPHPAISRLYSRPRLTRIIRAAMNAVLPRDLQEVEVAAGPLQGTRLLIYPRNELSFISGLWEFWVQEALLTHLHPGDRAWDIGAYIGYFALLMRKHCGPDNVYALEPDPSNRDRLQRVLAMNGVDDIEVIPNAAGPEDGMLELARQEHAPAASVTGGSGGIRVPVTTLDTLAEQVGPPHLVKMDVEGAEAGILRGAPKLLHEIRPRWILELHGKAGQEAVDILGRAGYQIHYLNRAESRTHQEHILALPTNFV